MDAYEPIPPFILDWMEGTWLNSFMLDRAWSWVAAETLHFVGMCLLFGSVLVMDLRLMGVARRTMSASSVHILVPVALTGFGINLLTGIFFFFGNPYRYAMNISFQIKIVLILLAGINVLYFRQRTAEGLKDVDADEKLPAYLRFAGWTSLLLWTAVIVFGRMIPYLGTG